MLLMAFESLGRETFSSDKIISHLREILEEEMSPATKLFHIFLLKETHLSEQTAEVFPQKIWRRFSSRLLPLNLPSPPPPPPSVH